MDLSPADAAYIAGFLDGEGSISILRGKTRRGKSYRCFLAVSVSNTCREVLEWIRVLVGGGKVSENSSRLHQEKVALGVWKPIYNLHWGGKKSEEILRAVYPWLRVKKGQAEIALRFRETVNRKTHSWERVPVEDIAFREQCRDALLRLNSGGPNGRGVGAIAL